MTDINQRDAVIVILSDLHNIHDHHSSLLDHNYSKLKLKFDLQQRGRIKWFRRIHEYLDRKKEFKTQNTIPIEFTKHRDCVIDYVRNLMMVSTDIVKKFPQEVLRDGSVMRAIMRKVYKPRLRSYGLLANVEGFEKHLKEVVNEKEKLNKIMQNSYGKEEIAFVVDLFNRGEFSVKEWVDTRYLDHILKNNGSNASVVTEIVKVYGKGLQYASEDLKRSKKIVMLAINQDTDALQFASMQLKKDLQVVQMAITRKGTSLSFAANEIKDNKDIVLLALENDRQAYHFASIRLKMDSEIMTKAQIYAFAPTDLLNDRDFALKVIQDDPSNFHLTKILQDDRELVLDIVKKNGNCYQYVSPSLKKDPEIIVAAVKQSGSMAMHVPSNMYNLLDDDILLEALRTGLNVSDLRILQKTLTKELAIEALLRDGSQYPYVRNHYDDNEIILAAIKGGLNNLLSYFGLIDKELGLEIVKKKGSNITHLAADLISDPDIQQAAILSDGFYQIYSEKSFVQRCEHEYSAILLMY